MEIETEALIVRDDDVPPLKKMHTWLGKRVVPRLRELTARGQRESGDGTHAT